MKKILTAMAVVVGLAGPGEALADAGPAEIDAAPAVALEAPNDSPASDGEAKGDEGGADTEDLGALGKEALSLAKDGRWIPLIGVMMFVIVGIGRRFVFGRVEWFKTQIGGYTLMGSVTVLLAIGLGIRDGFSVDTFIAAATAGGLSTALHTYTSDFSKAKKSRAG